MKKRRVSGRAKAGGNNGNVCFYFVKFPSMLLIIFAEIKPIEMNESSLFLFSPPLLESKCLCVCV